MFWAAVLSRGVVDADGARAADEATKPERPDSVAQILPVRERATAALLEQLALLDDAQRRWSWWDPDQTVGFTRRMQTYEATMHRVDAELVAGLPPSPIADAVAAGAVDQCVDVMWGWLPDWAASRSLATALLVAEDTGDRWVVDFGRWSGTDPASGRESDEPWALRAADGAVAAVTVTAPVQELALWAWQRGGTVRIEGDPGQVAAVTAVVANGIQ